MAPSLSREGSIYQWLYGTLTEGRGMANQRPRAASQIPIHYHQTVSRNGYAPLAWGWVAKRP